MKNKENRVPGEEGIWVLILCDLAVFSVFFLTILYYRAASHAAFAGANHLLNQRFGLINTMLLLTSSLFVALGVRRVRDQRRQALPLFLSAVLCGLGFVIVKAFEYHEKLASGITVQTNDFFMLYFVFTGIHLVHLLIGLLILTFLATVARHPENAAGRIVLIECGALFWHLVDLLWVILFARFYLVPQ